MKNILITGAAGFIGSNFVRMMSNYNKYNLILLDSLTYAGNMDNIKDLLNKVTFIKGNICNNELVSNIIRRFDIDIIVNFAAESHVDRSISNPSIFIQTNVMGTQCLLDSALHYWKNDNGWKKDVKFIQISTDETYGDIKGEGKFKETTPIAPNSPYSASKAGADHIVMAYHNTYGLPINITRCSNNYGPYQFPEKLIPVVIHKALSDSKIPVYGDGLQIRDWIHVNDHCNGIRMVMEKGKDGEVYNIGSDNEQTNLDLIRMILKILDKPESLIEHVTDRLGHDRHYAIDSSKIMKELGWKPNYSFDKGLEETIEWYKNHTDWINNIVTGEYKKINEMYCYQNP